MLLRMALEGDLAAAMAAQEARIERAMRLAADVTGEAVKGRIRRDALAAGLGPRLASTVRHKVYPERGGTMRPAVVISFKAQNVWQGVVESVVIRPGERKRFLAIPTEHCPARIFNKRPTPALYRRRYGEKRLGFVALEGGGGMLVDSQMEARRGQRGGFVQRKAGKKRTARSRRLARPVPMFWLVRQVRTKKRMDLDLYERDGAAMFGDLATAQLARVLADDGSAEEVEAFVTGAREQRSRFRSAQRQFPRSARGIPGYRPEDVRVRFRGAGDVAR